MKSKSVRMMSAKNATTKKLAVQDCFAIMRQMRRTSAQNRLQMGVDDKCNDDE